MGGLSTSYLRRALFWLVTTTAVYLLMNGAQIFETVLIVPAWTAAPPASLGIFQGPYGLDFKVFWIVFHSLHEITFILAFALCWKLTSIRRWLLGLLVVHIAVRVMNSIASLTGCPWKRRSTIRRAWGSASRPCGV
jgi:hypothetical protein